MNKRFFVYGLIILGLFMLIGGASAVTPKDSAGNTLSQIDVKTPTTINVTLSANATTVTLSGCGVSLGPTASGADTWVNFPNVVAQYSGTLYISATGGENGSASISCGTGRRPRRYIESSYEPAKPGVNEVVKIIVKDRTREDPLDDVEVDVYLGNKKIAYGLTDDKGLFEFTPNAEGSYLVTLDKHNYRHDEFSITVAGVAATTTTTTAVTTTTKAATTTTEATTTTTTTRITTTTKATTTTTVAQTTTTVAPATTTTQPAEPSGIPWLWVIVIIVIIIVVVYFVAMRGKGASEKTEGTKSKETVEETIGEEEEKEEEI